MLLLYINSMLKGDIISKRYHIINGIRNEIQIILLFYTQQISTAYITQ